MTLIFTMSNLKVINLFGGAGVGKSTLAAAIYADLKCSGSNVELTREVVKHYWYRSIPEAYQLQIFAEQAALLNELKGKVDIAITDSPLLLSCIYGDTSPLFKDLVKETYHEYDNVNFIIKRCMKYQPVGRWGSEIHAKECDIKILKLLKEMDEPYSVHTPNQMRRRYGGHASSYNN